MHPAQGPPQIGDQRIKGQCCSDLVPSDQHIIPTVTPIFGKDKPCHFAQPPLGAITGDGIANFLGTGETDAQAVCLTFGTFACLQVNAGRALPQRMRGADKIGAFGKDLQTNANRRKPCIRRNRRFQNAQVESSAYALSFARPLARRAFRILRPALVAIRARKPWRFLRTRFDGWNVRFIACPPVEGQTLHRIRGRTTFQTCSLEGVLPCVNALDPRFLALPTETSPHVPSMRRDTAIASGILRASRHL